jgi:hypothetical protein
MTMIRTGPDKNMAPDTRETPRDDLDETLEETFPASDAPANTPETGIRIEPAAEADQPDTKKTDEPA